MPSVGHSQNHADSAAALLEACGLGTVQVVAAPTWSTRGSRACRPVRVSLQHKARFANEFTASTVMFEQD